MERIKQTVPVLGINRAETDLTVKDGSCEKLHNMRYDAGAWRNIEAFRRIGSITSNGGFQLLHKHPVTADDLYIAIDVTGNIHEVRFADGIFTSTQTIVSGLSKPDAIFSFGNVLGIVAHNKEHYYVLYGAEYTRFEMPEPPDISKSSQMYSRFKIDFYAGIQTSPGIISHIYVGGDDLARLPAEAAEGCYYFTRVTDKTNKTLVLPMVDGEYWLGAIAVMVAFRMIDGTNVANSELMIFASDGGESAGNLVDILAQNMHIRVPESLRYGVFIGSKMKHSTCTNNFYIQPIITIQIPAGIDSRIIESVAIYSTRIVPIYDFEQTWDGKWSLSDRGTGTDDGSYWTPNFKKLFTKDVDLLQEPLYRVKEIAIKEITNNKHTENLSYSLLTNAESLPVYEPTQSLHSQVARCYYEYNGRLHKGNLRTRLFPGYSGFCMGEKSDDISTKLVCTLDIENTRKQVCRVKPGFSPTNLGRVISYPDYRAVHFEVCTNDPGSLIQKCLLDVTFEASKGNNYAFAVQKPSNNAKYPAFRLPETPVGYDRFVKADDVYSEPNRVQVSALNNMFSVPYANSYRLGVNEESILAIATVVDELSATRFGAFPLYVFTNRGVWSLESGAGEVVYSNILPVNHDKIVNPNTCAALETVFYITSRGVHALRGRSSELISRGLEQYPGEQAEYLSRAQILFQFKYGDLIVYNPDYRYAYVYSMSAGVWSSRDMVGQVLNNDAVITASAIATLTDERMIEPVECLIVTRPLKLGMTEFKRVETLVARIMSRDCFAHIMVEGSNDCYTWSMLRDAWCHVQSMDARLRRTATSFKFFRLRVHLTANCRLSTTGVDVEFYPRFVGRLR